MAGDGRYRSWRDRRGEEPAAAHGATSGPAAAGRERSRRHQVVYNMASREVLVPRLITPGRWAGRAADWDEPSWSMLGMEGGSGARWHLEIAIKKNV
jgi:hypothetical protein